VRRIFKSILIFIPVLLVQIYQLAISPYLPQSCRFVPSCSEYSIQAFRKHGLIKGIWLTVNRLRKCHPWGGHGYDPVP